MLNDITFTKENHSYKSDPIQVTNDVGIHLEFSDENKNTVYIYQSMTGDKFYLCAVEHNVGGVFDSVIEGVLPGMYIQIISNESPTVAKILM